jgi:hypothetical protein
MQVAGTVLAALGLGQVFVYLTMPDGVPDLQRWVAGSALFLLLGAVVLLAWSAVRRRRHIPGPSPSTQAAAKARSTVNRKGWAYVLFGLGSVALAAFYWQFFDPTVRPPPVWVPAVTLIAGLAFGWGLFFALPERLERLRRFLFWYLALASPVAVLIALSLTMTLVRLKG